MDPDRLATEQCAENARFETRRPDPPLAAAQRVAGDQRRFENALARDELEGMGFFGDTLAGEDIIIAAAVDLGNLAGKATGSVPHPTLKDANGKPVESRMACRTLTSRALSCRQASNRCGF